MGEAPDEVRRASDHNPCTRAIGRHTGMCDKEVEQDAKVGVVAHFIDPAPQDAPEVVLGIPAQEHRIDDQPRPSRAGEHLPEMQVAVDGGRGRRGAGAFRRCGDDVIELDAWKRAAHCLPLGSESPREIGGDLVGAPCRLGRIYCERRHNLRQRDDSIPQRLGREGPLTVQSFQKQRPSALVDIVDPDGSAAIPEAQGSRFGDHIVTRRSQAQDQGLLAAPHRHDDGVRPVHRRTVERQLPVGALVGNQPGEQVQPLPAGPVVPPPRHLAERGRHREHATSVVVTATDRMPRRSATVVKVTTGAGRTRRIELTMHKPWFALYAGVKPTLVIEGRGQPVQWGLGTWQVSSDQTVVLGVFLFNRLWRFGQAEFALEPDQGPSLVYRAPPLPFLPGRIRLHA